jgi:hypothetical protein
VNVLESVERWLMYALGHYRRGIEMLVPVSAPLAQVSLYYSSFFAANAILGMFGGWIGHTNTGPRLVDVDGGTPGSLRLQIHRRIRSPGGARGSHARFWEVFYDATPSISAWAPPELQPALTPVNGDFAWQTAERNNVNYDMFHAWSASALFYNTFKPAKLSSLAGPLRLQMEAAERMIGLGLHFATDLSIANAALVGCGFNGTRVQIRKRLLAQAAPKLVTQSELSALLEM